MTLLAFIDDEPDQQTNTKQQFESAGDFSVDVFAPQEYPSLRDYDELLGHGFDAIVVDFNLRQLADVQYNGLELARHLRVKNPLLPLVVLTGHFDEAEGKELSSNVDLVIEKDKFNDNDTYYQVMLDRIRRLVGRYVDALDDREREYGVLIQAKLAGTLDAEQEERLQALRKEIERPGAANALEAKEILDQFRADSVKAATEASQLLQQMQKLRREIGGHGTSGAKGA